MVLRPKYWHIGLILMILSACGTSDETQGDRPNFIIVYTDDQRQDALGLFDNDVILTPYLDKYLSQGLKYTQANVVFALCSPSRAALLTGRYGSANGVLQLGSGLKEGERTLAQYLKSAGYQTAHTGKWHLRQPPNALGFDFYSYFRSNGSYYNRKIIEEGDTLHPAIHCDQYVTNRAIDFLNLTVQSEAPFFLFHNTQTPHMNGQLIWDAREETLAQYQDASMPVAANRLDDLSGKPAYLQDVRNRTQALKYGYPDSIAIAQHTKEYYAVITEMDGFLGHLFKAIEQLELRENTYLIFMSDNGWMLGDHGFTSKVLPYQPSTAVPLCILGPGIGTGVRDDLVLNIDLAPTILSLAGLPIPADMHGMDISPTFGDGGKTREYFVYEGLGTYGGALPNLTVVSSDYRLITTYSDASLSEIIHQELYDQKNDPLEMNNLIEKKGMQDKVSRMNAQIEMHFETVNPLNP